MGWLVGVDAGLAGRVAEGRVSEGVVKPEEEGSVVWIGPGCVECPGFPQLVSMRNTRKGETKKSGKRLDSIVRFYRIP
jgi:hypothetical protein